VSKVRVVPIALAAAFVLGTGAAYAQDAEEPVADEAMAADSIDGTWTADTSIGSFDDFSGSWVGFRVNEVLSPGGEVQAVGRTPAVSGDLEVFGSVIQSAEIEADLTAVLSDRPRRDNAIQRALGTGDFPTASFVASEPVDLGAIPGAEPFSVSVPGSLTIRDVSQDVSLDLTGQRVGDTVVVVGALPVDFPSFGVTMPTAPVVVSVEDNGDLELQLFFTRDAEMADGEEMAEEATEE
jgi:polyisoprenoid-binding protein YceI